MINYLASVVKCYNYNVPALFPLPYSFDCLFQVLILTAYFGCLFQLLPIAVSDEGLADRQSAISSRFQ